MGEGAKAEELKAVAIKRKPKSSPLNEMPAAKLYLDEVRDIVNILAAPDSDSTNESVVVKYRVRDLECDTIEELGNIGGSARRFEIVVQNGIRFSSLRLRGSFTFLQLSCSENDFWVKHGQIRRIFDDNSIWWKNLISLFFSRVPYWLMLSVLVSSLALNFWGPATGRHQGFTAGYWGKTVLVVGVIILYLVYFGGSVVRLRYSHTRGVRRWIEDHGTQVVLLLLAAFLGAIAKEVISRFWH